MTLAIFAFGYAGLAALSLAMDRHHDQVFGRRPEFVSRQALRCGGIALLVLSFAAATAARGWSIGPVAFLTMISVGGLLLAFLLPYAPRLAAFLAAAAMTLGVFGTIISR